VKLAAPPWWRNPPPSDYYRRCYRTKSQALHAFASLNEDVIQQYGGLNVVDDGGGFDSTNARYGLRGKKRARTIADAIWESLPKGRPFCLDRIDIETLNANQAVEYAGGFRIPDHVLEWQQRQIEERYWREREQEEMAGEGVNVMRECSMVPLPRVVRGGIGYFLGAAVGSFGAAFLVRRRKTETQPALGDAILGVGLVGFVTAVVGAALAARKPSCT
jgi:hypothetical protein